MSSIPTQPNFYPIGKSITAGIATLKLESAAQNQLSTMKPPIFTPLITHDQLQGRLKMLNPWS